MHWVPASIEVGLWLPAFDPLCMRCFLLLAAVVWSRCRSLWQRVRRQPAAVSMRLHAFTELAKRQGCEICVYYSDHFPGTL